MNKRTKIITAFIVVALIAAVTTGYVKSKGVNENVPVKSVKVGAILPLSGPASAFGEPLRNGIELALNGRSDIKVSYEDSMALPAVGASAYQKLYAQGVDVMISAYSGVSIPLTKLADQNKIPLIMTIVAADNVTNDYSYRYYAKPNSYVEPAFNDLNSPLTDLTDIAILYRNDEFGKSVSGILSNTITANGKNVVISEGYKVNENDFSTALLKIKNTKPQAVMFITGTPSEAVNIIKKAYELRLESVFVEASTSMSDPTVQKQAPNMTYYTTSFRFSLPDDNVEFKQSYKNVYANTPNFAAAFGYDIGKLLINCADNGDDMQACLSEVNSVNGLTGDITNIDNHEINPLMILLKVN
jgi:branched-chain amino acid transport system substrate-binding protein